MTYNPNQAYGYPPDASYYMEDADEFLPDYIESDALSEHQQMLQAHQNVTELYSRSDMGMAVTGQVMTYPQSQNQYVNQCYYESPPTTKSARHLTAIPFQDYVQVYDPRTRQYRSVAASSFQDPSYDEVAYRPPNPNVKVPQMQSKIPRAYQEVAQPTDTLQKQQAVKRHPIKVGTPKFYRKAAASSVYKRPSALCLPVNSQPDPAVHRKPKKQNSDVQYGFQNTAFTPDNTDNQHLKNPEEPIITDHIVSSEGDFNLPMLEPTKLDEMFAEIEKEATGMQKPKSKGDIAKIVKLLKPRVPPSIKARQQKEQSQTSNAEVVKEKHISTEENNVKAEEGNHSATAVDSIERLLNQLKKCELAATMVDDKGAERDASQNSDNSKNKKEKGQKRKSFNYEDISQKMCKTKSQMDAFERELEEELTCSSHDLARRSMSSSRSFGTRPPLDDHCALELHRSKSYIVNLIDRALSKELGTIPSHRQQKEFEHMNPRKAIETMNKHACSKCDKELSLEITSALTESIISTATAPEIKELHNAPPSLASSSKGKICCCNAEEPTYIKQLKQLRWGHLKHIQREVRRLEDLERFLDSCTLNTISEL